ncbi:RHS repeat-associated core domain-containing protein [Paenibacillus thiaminolyticus]|uniref:RHS repeat-associated core domain-containing protein n=1 Tax=Paenibacillus thiaminolyticus TaxID=49283 RepID=UPI002175A8CB|nr:RHS repeat-associated core domain-containing protein [Paenibacillus thiaminolyticus]
MWSIVGAVALPNLDIQLASHLRSFVTPPQSGAFFVILYGIKRNERESDHQQNVQDAFGHTLSATEGIPNRFRYAGEQFDPVTQQYYLRARFYNPVIARFTQEDEYRGDGLNLYVYVGNNPIRYVDPSGYSSQNVGCGGGGKKEGPYEESDSLKIQPPKSAANRRNSPGTITGGYKTKTILRGTDGNIDLIPKEVSDQLAGKSFRSFSDFQKNFWKAVSNTKYADEFVSYHIANKARMRNGNAPFADISQQLGQAAWPYNIHHRTPIGRGGAVYDLDNLLVIAQRTHAEILEVSYHGYNGFKRN